MWSSGIKKNPKSAEIMVFADDAAKVNRVLDKMNLTLSNPKPEKRWWSKRQCGKQSV